MFPHRLLSLVFSVVAVSAWAHDPLEGTSTVRLYTNSIDLAITLNGDTAARLSEDADISGTRFDPSQFDNNLSIFKNSAAHLFEIFVSSEQLAAFETNAFLGKENDLEYRLRYPHPSGAIKLNAAYLRCLPDEEYGAVLTVLDMERNVVVGQKLLRRDDSTFEIPASTSSVETNVSTSSPAELSAAKKPPTQSISLPSFRDFLKLGVEHILTGYDHLLFLAGLLIACRRPGTIFVIITSFTLAHSVTLALAALNVVTISSRMIEPAIAATIVFVGVENLWRREQKFRWVVAFVFGLIHGFGFATALKAAGVGAYGTPLLKPLFSFNLGIELGQITVAAIFLPIWWKLKTLRGVDRVGTTVLSVTVAVIGAYWFLQRVF